MVAAGDGHAAIDVAQSARSPNRLQGLQRGALLALHQGELAGMEDLETRPVNPLPAAKVSVFATA